MSVADAMKPEMIFGRCIVLKKRLEGMLRTIERRLTNALERLKKNGRNWKEL